MLGLGKTLPWLLNAGKGLLGGALKLGTGAAVIGAGAFGVDLAVNDGKGSKTIVNKGVDWYNETLNTAAVDLDNTQSLLNTQAEGMAWFNSWNSFFYSLCDFVGLESGKEFFKGRMERTNTEIRDFIDDQRDALSEQNGNGQNATPSVAAPSVEPGSPAIEAGDVSVGSAFASAGYGLETGIVSMGTGLTSLVSGSYEALTTDKGWGASISDDFNSQKAATMNFLENVHGKPTIDTPLERNLAAGGEFASWLIPAGLAAKATGSIVGGLANAGKVEPALGFQAPKLALS
jgi:hypothetical protein